MTDPTVGSRGRRPVWKRVRQWIVRFLAAIGVFFLVYHGCFSLDKIVSPSMAPTLQGVGPEGGDWVLTEKVSYWFRQPRRWEVVPFVNRDGIEVMKRVVGLPDETVGIADYRVQVDGTAVPFPSGIEHLKYYGYGHVGKGRTLTCDGGYFVLGDDSKDSQDSRYNGVLPGDRVNGRAWLIVWPPDRIGFVTP